MSKCPICDRDDCRAFQVCCCEPDEYCKLRYECEQNAVNWRERALQAETALAALQDRKN